MGVGGADHERAGMEPISLRHLGIEVDNIIHNSSVPHLYELAVHAEPGGIASSGALIAHSGKKTGRSPKDKRIIEHPHSKEEIWWGPVNIPLDESSFLINLQRAIDYFNSRDYLYVFDGYAGWDPAYQLKVRVICTRAYHALFMNNMLIRPRPEQVAQFGQPDLTIFNAGAFPANPLTGGMTSGTSIGLSFERQEFVILGTLYAGEMKKGVFTAMNYWMPKRGVLSMHCSANEGPAGDVSLFFGLSGTGKTTLSADPHRRLIGDDEHCWSDNGVFNIEGGCYAKCIDLSPQKEPEIYNAIRFGSVLENVVYDEDTREVDFTSHQITENTRASYPIEFIPNAKIPCVGGHPKNFVFLTCDAFGVLPPVAKLSPAQAMYHFISGYTAKVAGTEVGITEPQVTFSACFGSPFLVWHPTKYAQMLAEKMERHASHCWLVNTGWSGGPHGEGSRMSLKITRAIIDAIHSGALSKVESSPDPIFGFQIPKSCPNVPEDVLHPRRTWPDGGRYDSTARRLAHQFVDNFQKYSTGASEEVMSAGPRV
jgi:phosphoenolpyruvate carboxykinase (ATP)